MDILYYFGKLCLKFDSFCLRAKTYYYSKLLKLAKSSSVSGSNNVAYPQNIEVGENSYINGGGEIVASPNAKITIGKNCLISYRVHMCTDMHQYQSKEKSINMQGHREANIIIEDDVWIGFGAQIMAGVTLHKGCVVGAGAIVTKDIPSYAVVGGIPAKIIRYRE